MDERRLKESFVCAAAYGDEVPRFFYSHLFLAHPEVRDMFPVSMVAQRDKLMNALGRILAEISSPGLVPFLQALGRDHRKFGTLAEHYPAFGASLLATLAHFNGTRWNAELARDWTQAYRFVARVMLDAAADDASGHPPCWGATVTGHERRAADITVLRVVPDAPLSYLPGQSVAVECEERPRLWRYFSMANAPRDDGSIDFHVRVIDGGPVSTALARSVRAGSRLRLGAPAGTLRLNAGSGRDLVLAAGGTGLAPLKAMIEQAAEQPRPPLVHLVFGARTAPELYDLADLVKMTAQWSWLTVIPAVSGEPGFGGETGTVAAVIDRRVPLTGQDAYVCGPAAMVTATVSRLQSLGLPNDHIYVEDLGWSEQ